MHFFKEDEEESSNKKRNDEILFLELFVDVNPKNASSKRTC